MSLTKAYYPHDITKNIYIDFSQLSFVQSAIKLLNNLTNCMKPYQLFGSFLRLKNLRLIINNYLIPSENTF